MCKSCFLPTKHSVWPSKGSPCIMVRSWTVFATIVSIPRRKDNARRSWSHFPSVYGNVEVRDVIRSKRVQRYRQILSKVKDVIPVMPWQMTLIKLSKMSGVICAQTCIGKNSTCTQYNLSSAVSVETQPTIIVMKTEHAPRCESDTTIPMSSSSDDVGSSQKRQRL